MKKSAVPLATIILTVLLLAQSAFAWRFASFADSRGSDNGVNSAVLSRIVDLVNKENCDLVIFEGDAVGGSRDEAQLSSQMEHWEAIMKKLNCPWYYSTGNHEISAPDSELVVKSNIKMPMNGPANLKELVYSFDHKDAHFVSLDSNQFRRFHHMQLGWLSADLAKNKKPCTFVFAHEPAFPAGPHKGSSLDADATERDAFWKRLKDGGVQVYFCGHEHLYKRSSHDGILQIISGSAGAPLVKADPPAQSVYNYVVVDVEGGRIRGTAKDDSGTVIDTWSVRGH